MHIKKLMNLIEMHYRHHGIIVRLELLKTTRNYDRMIFQFIVKPGTKVNLIFNRAHDVQTALRIPVFEPFMDDMKICLLVSSHSSMQNSLIKMLSSPAFRKSRMLLPVALGKDMKGEMFFMDLATAPHVMYGGSTNSGKSIGLKCLILSLLAKNPVRKVNLVLIDVGTDTMEPFEDVPHLSCPVVRDVQTGFHVINSLVSEMDRRKDLDDDELRKLPALICIIDEYISFISDAEGYELSEDLGTAISLLLQRGRHAKIHLVLAAQNPKSKFMKSDTSNITTRIAFKCNDRYVSNTILGKSGAEKLPGRGAMLFKSSECPDPIRLQGAFISDNDILRIVSRIKISEHNMENKFLIPKMDEQAPIPQTAVEIAPAHPSARESEEKLFADIIMWSLKRDNVSAEQIKEGFRMGNKAYTIVDRLYEMGLISEKFSNQPREVLIHSIDDMPPETISLLERHSYSPEQIEEILADKEEC